MGAFFSMALLSSIFWVLPLLLIVAAISALVDRGKHAEDGKKVPFSIAARNFFLSFFTFSLMYAGILAIISVFLQAVDMQFQSFDIKDSIYLTRHTIEMARFTVSALVVLVPVYLLTSWYVASTGSSSAPVKNTGTWKGLTYFTLFITAITVIGVLIAVVNALLNGDVAAQFIIKMVGVLAVVIGVFLYSLWDIKREVGIRSQLPKISAAILLVLVVILSIWAISGTNNDLPEVYSYPGGHLIHGSNDEVNAGKWVEVKRSSVSDTGDYHFVETGRGQTYINIYDASRNMELRIPIGGGLAEWSDDGGQTWVDWFYVDELGNEGNYRVAPKPYAEPLD